MKVKLFLLLIVSVPCFLQPYEPNWDSLDTRPLPQWYDDAKIGIFIHWSVFSVPSFATEWFWFFWKALPLKPILDYMSRNYKPNFNYQNFAQDFTAELFNATEWADIFKNSGAKYVILTSKHHEGYTLWPSKYSYSWNAMDVGPNRDLVGELAEAVRASNLTFGLYHSLYEWFHPLYMIDKANQWQTRNFAEHKSMAELYELVETYKPWIIWSDGSGETPDTYWNATGFLAWLYNDSPVKDVAVVNDRWGIGTDCKHGDFFSCQDRYNPGVLQVHKWENAMTIDRKSWGYRRNAKLEDYLTTLELLSEIVSTVSCGGNILLNVGPTKDGTIDPIFQQRLKDIGNWLEINGEAIYSSTPWTAQNDSLTPGVWYTSKNNTVYSVALFWPEQNQLNLGSVLDIFTTDTSVVLLGNEDGNSLEWKINENSVAIKFPDKSNVNGEWAYVLKIIGASADTNL